ncbi:MAG: hypothetical protein HOB38_15955 [Deltaproteobacteria bacterium]|nr:hypothetical protein [Deltaproteobacteria bacterium]
MRDRFSGAAFVLPDRHSFLKPERYNRPEQFDPWQMAPGGIIEKLKPIGSYRE